MCSCLTGKSADAVLSGAFGYTRRIQPELYSMESMIGWASSTISSKRDSCPATVIARVRIDMRSGTSTRYRR